MRVFAANAVWTAAVRIPLFWMLVGGALYALAHAVPYSDWRLIASVTGQSQDGLVELVTTKDFAFALASAIVQFGLALGAAFFVTHVLLVRAALRTATRALGPNGQQHFAQGFDRVSQRLRQHALVGHAWREFEETLVRTDVVVRNTVRPQAFINLAHARERLSGLKMMASIPGFFVGLGLLLTFIGLVLALNKAAGSTTAGSASAMTAALSGLLDAATFKFSTSIAGLGASLVLSLLFRLYQIWIEGAFESFTAALEARMRFQPPQRIAAESLELLAAQRDQLKEINSEAFFSHLGEQVAPQLRTAFAPISASLDRTVDELKQTSRSGIENLVENFVNKLDQGAGRELGQVVDTLVSLRDGLHSIRTSLAGSGQDVSDKLAAAAENLSRVVADAGAALGHSAAGVAGTVETAMERVVGRLEAQTATFGERMTTLQGAMTSQMEESGRIARAAGEAAASASTRAAGEAAAATKEATQAAAEAMRAAIGDVTQSLSADVGRLSGALQAVEAAFKAQTQHIDGVSLRSRETAAAFGQVAEDVRTASQPLFAQSERVAQSADTMAKSIAGAVEAVTATQRAASGIADELAKHLNEVGRVWDGIGGVWKGYEARFKDVDDALGQAVQRFGEEISRHQDAMRSFVQDVDRHTEAILKSISSAVNDLDNSVQELNETLSPFIRGMKRGEAAE
ncbi:MAG: anti-phage defense protein ZorA [Bradyrhizobiaceae bacterium]|nr:anti-phage defense protein ZorA [Bradyrhizobiaceae bacterium]